MPSWICCPDGHSSGGSLIREAAIALSDGRIIGVCKKCGKDLQYRIEHTYGNDPTRKRHAYMVTRAVRLKTRIKDGENYDPFLLVLSHIESNEEQILPIFWAVDQSGNFRGGQYPPLLSLEEWKALFREIDASF